MSLDNGAIKAFETVIDEKIRKRQESLSKETTHLAEVKRIDNDGVIWVHIYGGALETPASSTIVSVSAGDVVNVVISNGSLKITANLSHPAASTSYVDGKNEQVNNTIQEVKMIVAQKANLQQLIAAEATIGTLVANYANLNEVVAGKASIEKVNADEARIESLEGSFANIDRIITDTVEADYARIDFANINAENVLVAKIRELFARSGWFDEVTITGDASITGQLKSVLIDGDTARFRNIYADALKLLGPDGLYYALNLAGLDASQAAALIAQYPGEELEGGLHGSHIIAESVTATQIDVSSLVAAMLLAEVVQVGASGGIHTEMNGVRFSFLAGGYHLPSDPTGLDPLEPLEGEVAYIAVDPDTRDSMFYINRAVVVTDLRFGRGNWKWYSRDNDNMALKWMGG